MMLILKQKYLYNILKLNTTRVNFEIKVRKQLALLSIMPFFFVLFLNNIDTQMMNDFLNSRCANDV